MRISLLSLFFCIICTSLFAQSNAQCDRTIEGQILDIDLREALPFATIKILGTEQGAVADENGYFIIEKICDEEVDLEIRFLGYKTIVHHHDFHHSNPTIFMAADETLLESVVIEQALNVHDLKTLSSKDIELGSLDASGKSAGEIFAQSSGISLLKTGQNISKPIVHGLHSNRVLIINNGVRHAYQSWGNEHGLEVDPSQIDKIQLIKGASTVRYGSEALGGVILFDAPSPAYNTNLGGEVNGGFQTNGRAFNGEVSLTQGFERVAWRASLSGIRQGDLTAPAYQLTNTGKSEVGFSLGGKFHFPIVDLDIYASRFDQDLGILRGSVNGSFEDLLLAFEAEIPNETGPFSYDINNPKQETTHDLLRLKASLYLGKQQFDVQYAYQNNLRKEFDVRRGNLNSQPSINLKLKSHSLDLDWDHPSDGTWSGTYGIQLFAQDNNNLFGTGTPPFIPNYNTYSAGFFGVESYTKENATYEVGLRYDFMQLDVRGRDLNQDVFRNNQNYQNFSFTLGVIKQLNQHVSIRTNIGSAWRAPNIGELYSFGRHQNILQYGLWRYVTSPSFNTTTVLTNQDRPIKNEQGLKWISSIEMKKDQLSFEITPYINYIQNYLFTRPLGIRGTIRGTLPFFIYDQTNALYTGIDVDVRKQWNESFHSELKASYVYARDTKNKGSFIGIPPINIQLELKKQYGNFSIAITPEWTARQFTTPPVVSPSQIINAQEVPFELNETFDLMEAPDGFFLLGSSVAYEKNNFLFRIKGENLLNASYRRYTNLIRYYADEPGINFAAHVSYSF
ncbi:MAG: TonB-dependent receptor [Ekhidna sp.]